MPLVREAASSELTSGGSLLRRNPAKTIWPQEHNLSNVYHIALVFSKCSSPHHKRGNPFAWGGGGGGGGVVCVLMILLSKHTQTALDTSDMYGTSVYSTHRSSGRVHSSIQHTCSINRANNKKHSRRSIVSEDTMSLNQIHVQMNVYECMCTGGARTLCLNSLRHHNAEAVQKRSAATFHHCG